MSDEDWYKPHCPPVPPRQPKPGEPLFEFIRGSDRAPMSCELRFHGESYGWEAQFLECGHLFYSRSGFVARALAVQWPRKNGRRWRNRRDEMIRLTIALVVTVVLAACGGATYTATESATSVSVLEQASVAFNGHPSPLTVKAKLDEALSGTTTSHADAMAQFEARKILVTSSEKRGRRQPRTAGRGNRKPKKTGVDRNATIN